jgi:hypothetical protein
MLAAAAISNFLTAHSSLLIPHCSLFIILFSFFICFPLSAQTAAELDAMLETEAVSAGRAARFVLGAAELAGAGLSGSAAEDAAYQAAFSSGWISSAAANEITMKEAALLVMKAFGTKGGLWYTLFGTQRYAYREMVYRGLIQGRSDPDMKVSGIRLLQIIGRVLNYTGENEPLAAGQPDTGGER